MGAEALRDLSPPAGDRLLEELQRPAHAPTMGKLQKVRYTHQDMIDFIIQNPWASQGELAARYGYSQSWVSNILASDAFQSAMAARREEILDPVMKATIEERFRALVHQSLTRLMEKLEKPQVSDTVVLRAAELGAKALGLGGHAPPAVQAPAPDRLNRLAERLVYLQANVRERSANGEERSIDLQMAERVSEVSGGLSPRESGGAEPHAGQSPQGTVRADAGQPGQAALQDGRGV